VKNFSTKSEKKWSRKIWKCGSSFKNWGGIYPPPICYPILAMGIRKKADNPFKYNKFE
tara:strand:- start:347 stop:520 length:174 start_codon:yes stop_codon:yes gene_type:complete